MTTTATIPITNTETSIYGDSTETTNSKRTEKRKVKIEYIKNHLANTLFANRQLLIFFIDLFVR